MDKVITGIILSASIITACGTIFTAFKMFGINSKKGINKYIQNQVSPDLKEIKDSVNVIHNEMKTMKRESDDDKMQRLRYECLCFASDLRKGEPKTRQEYEEIFRMEVLYDNLIEKYNIKNGYMEEEMLFVHEQYRKLSETN